jgi:hypothetical protein
MTSSPNDLIKGEIEIICAEKCKNMPNNIDFLDHGNKNLPIEKKTRVQSFASKKLPNRED